MFEQIKQDRYPFLNLLITSKLSDMRVSVHMCVCVCIEHK